MTSSGDSFSSGGGSGRPSHPKENRLRSTLKKDDSWRTREIKNQQEQLPVRRTPSPSPSQFRVQTRGVPVPFSSSSPVPFELNVPNQRLPIDNFQTTLHQAAMAPPLLRKTGLLTRDDNAVQNEDAHLTQTAGTTTTSHDNCYLSNREKYLTSADNNYDGHSSFPGHHNYINNSNESDIGNSRDNHNNHSSKKTLEVWNVKSSNKTGGLPTRELLWGGEENTSHISATETTTADTNSGYSYSEPQSELQQEVAQPQQQERSSSQQDHKKLATTFFQADDHRQPFTVEESSRRQRTMTSSDRQSSNRDDLPSSQRKRQSDVHFTSSSYDNRNHSKLGDAGGKKSASSGGTNKKKKRRPPGYIEKDGTPYWMKKLKKKIAKGKIVPTLGPSDNRSPAPIFPPPRMLNNPPPAPAIVRKQEQQQQQPAPPPVWAEPKLRPTGSYAEHILEEKDIKSGASIVSLPSPSGSSVGSMKQHDQQLSNHHHQHHQHHQQQQQQQKMRMIERASPNDQMVEMPSSSVYGSPTAPQQQIQYQQQQQQLPPLYSQQFPQEQLQRPPLQQTQQPQQQIVPQQQAQRPPQEECHQQQTQEPPQWECHQQQTQQPSPPLPHLYPRQVPRGRMQQQQQQQQPCHYETEQQQRQFSGEQFNEQQQPQLNSYSRAQVATEPPQRRSYRSASPVSRTATTRLPPSGANSHSINHRVTLRSASPTVRAVYSPPVWASGNVKLRPTLTSSPPLRSASPGQSIPPSWAASPVRLKKTGNYDKVKRGLDIPTLKQKAEANADENPSHPFDAATKQLVQEMQRVPLKPVEKVDHQHQTRGRIIPSSSQYSHLRQEKQVSQSMPPPEDRPTRASSLPPPMEKLSAPAHPSAAEDNLSCSSVSILTEAVVDVVDIAATKIQPGMTPMADLSDHSRSSAATAPSWASDFVKFRNAGKMKELWKEERPTSGTGKPKSFGHGAKVMKGAVVKLDTDYTPIAQRRPSWQPVASSNNEDMPFDEAALQHSGASTTTPPRYPRGRTVTSRSAMLRLPIQVAKPQRSFSSGPEYFSHEKAMKSSFRSMSPPQRKATMMPPGSVTPPRTVAHLVDLSRDNAHSSRATPLWAAERPSCADDVMNGKDLKSHSGFSPAMSPRPTPSQHSLNQPKSPLLYNQSTLDDEKDSMPAPPSSYRSPGKHHAKATPKKSIVVSICPTASNRSSLQIGTTVVKGSAAIDPREAESKEVHVLVSASFDSAKPTKVVDIEPAGSTVAVAESQQPATNSMAKRGEKMARNAHNKSFVETDETSPLHSGETSKNGSKGANLSSPSQLSSRAPWATMPTAAQVIAPRTYAEVAAANCPATHEETTARALSEKGIETTTRDNLVAGTLAGGTSETSASFEMEPDSTEDLILVIGAENNDIQRDETETGMSEVGKIEEIPEKENPYPTDDTNFQSTGLASPSVHFDDSRAVDVSALKSTPVPPKRRSEGADDLIFNAPKRPPPGSPNDDAESTAESTKRGPAEVANESEPKSSTPSPWKKTGKDDVDRTAELDSNMPSPPLRSQRATSPDHSVQPDNESITSRPEEAEDALLLPLVDKLPMGEAAAVTPAPPVIPVEDEKSVLVQRIKPRHCNHCNAEDKADSGKRFKYCGKCRLVKYCSRHCQKKNWKTHKLECCKQIQQEMYGP